MKKKTVSVLMVFTMAALSFVGCQQQNRQQVEDTNTANVEDATNETDPSEGDSAADYVYDYEQELNIVDDNCRNYYEIFVYSFYDSNGDGIGDLNGVTEKLDYISDLGFNGIWLMPIMPSDTYHKYDVKDYMNIDSQYGTVDDFRTLADECHKRGIRLIIDFVINHTSSQHPWFIEACSYLRQLPEGQEPDLEACPYVGYYNFTREYPDNTYYKVSGSNWYYEGSFWSEMPDLALTNETVQKEFEAVSDFWLDLGVDGYRMDAALHFEEGDTAENNAILNWLYSYCKEKNPDFYMVSEVWAGSKTIADYYESMTPSMFNFGMSSAEGDLEKTARGTMKASAFVKNMADIQKLYGEKNPDFIDAPFLTNHDQPRVANNLNNNAAYMKMACGLLMTMNGSPFVYYGEEIGMKSSGNKDENKRLPMLWSSTDSEGMCIGPRDADTGIESAFPDVQNQLQDAGSLLNYYRRAVRLRNENPEIARGSITVIDMLCEGNQAAVTKTYEESTIGIVYNTSEEEITVMLAGTDLEGMNIRGYLTENGEIVTLENGSLTLPAYSICILK